MKFVIALLLLTLAAPCAAQDLGFQEAAAKYGAGLPMFAHVLEAISWVESRHNPDALRKNVRIKKDGSTAISYDLGHMQINDHFWKAKIQAVDPRLWDLMLKDPKICTKIGAWILAQNIQKYGFNWNAIAAYNTGRAIDLADCNGDEDRVERGRQYAIGVYNYLARNGYLKTSNQSLAWEPKSKATASDGSHARETHPALPMKQTLNIAEYRSNGKWRLIQ